jgi:peptidoglycan/LPS O-acetylase OafA/YrhL
MPDDPHARLDERLRVAFEPGPHAAARIAGAALAEHATARPRRWLGLAAAAATVCIVSALVFWPSRPIPRVEPAALALSGSLTDGLLVVSLPDGSVAITGGEARRGRPDDGYGIVIVEGELR